MSSLFPAILIGGPPHRGKSVFAYILSRLLKNRQVAHYLLRATPNGEGNWFYDASFSLAEKLRRKRSWDASFEQAVEKSLQRRPLPFLVDVGGKPTLRQQEIFGHCSHYIILGKDKEEWAEWRAICEGQQLQPLAEIRSVLEADDALLSEHPLLRLQLGNLDRERDFGLDKLGFPWQKLAERVATTIGYNESEMWDYHRTRLPFDALALNLHDKQSKYDSNSRWWKTEMLPRLLQDVCQESALAIYGRAPTWVASALALHTQKPIHCFDAQYGWLTPPTLQHSADNGAWQVTKTHQPHLTELAFTLAPTHLAPKPTLKGPLPSIEPTTTILLSGKLPIWLYMGLARYYAHHGHTIAIAHPRLKAGVQINRSAVGKQIPWHSSIAGSA
ncbi:MAG: CRISPR-associated protein Csx3 [Ardenticatenaceae bacterium]